MTILLDSGYIVKKKDLTKEQNSKLRNDLSVYPEVFGGPQKNFIRDSDKFKIYRESENRYRLPKFYGIDTFGKATTDKTKDGVRIDVDFKGSLKTELNQPIACNKTIELLKTIGGCILSLPIDTHSLSLLKYALEARPMIPHINSLQI